MPLNIEIQISEEKKQQLLAEAGMPETTAVSDLSQNDTAMYADSVVYAALEDVSPKLEYIIRETHGDLDKMVEELGSTHERGGSSTS